MPTYIYTRYSTEKQSEDSIEIQENICREYANRKGFTVDEVFSDPATSAKYPVNERPSGKRLAAKLRRGDVLIVKCLDRLSRAVEDYGLLKQWDADGIAVHLADENGNSLDMSTATGKMIVVVKLMQSEYERNITSERTAAKAKHYRENDKRWGSVPVGKKCVNGKLVDDEYEREAVAKARRIRSAGKSYREVAAQLADLGYLNRKGEPYHHNQVRRMCG